MAFYAALGQDVTLNITVKAFPDFTDLSSAFTWRRDGVDLDAGDVTSTNPSPEVFVSELMISSVTARDYSNYTVTVSNDVKYDVTFLLTLLERGTQICTEYIKI